MKFLRFFLIIFISLTSSVKADLNKKLFGKVEFIGNPFMDPFLNQPQSLPKTNKRLGILPGSRMPEVGRNLCLILRVIDYISNLQFNYTEISFELCADFV